MNSNTTFSQIYLREVMNRVRKHVPVGIRKTVWTYKYTDGKGEFHLPKCKMFPDGVYWYGQVENLWDARAKGWELALKQLGVEQ